MNALQFALVVVCVAALGGRCEPGVGQPRLGGPEVVDVQAYVHPDGHGQLVACGVVWSYNTFCGFVLRVLLFYQTDVVVVIGVAIGRSEVIVLCSVASRDW